MLWWMEVCAKAEGAIWENAVFGPLHLQFPGSKFINYTQMTTDGKVDTSSTVRDLGVLPTPNWPDHDRRRSLGKDAVLTEQLPRAVWSSSGANSQWRDGGVMAVDGTQRRVNFFPQHIQGQVGAVAQQVMDSAGGTEIADAISVARNLPTLGVAAGGAESGRLACHLYEDLREVKWSRGVPFVYPSIRRGWASQPIWDVFEASEPAALSDIRALGPGGTRARRLPRGSPLTA
jgi:hypothetical protein